MGLPKSYRGSPVPFSRDLQRILKLPERAAIDTAAAIKKWNAIFRKDVSTCDCKARWGRCITSFNAVQAEAFEEFERVGGLFAGIGVGSGKTGVSLFLAAVRPQVQNALLLIPAYVRNQFLEQDVPMWSAHFHIPNLGMTAFDPQLPTLHVMSYSELSLPKNSDVLKRLRPDLIICDEAHNLKDTKRPRVKRIVRAIKENPNTRFAFMSGTLFSKSIKDGAHLAYFALRDLSPFPVEYQTLDHWSSAIDPLEYNAPPGKLNIFVSPGKSLRDGYSERILKTPGVIATRKASVDASLAIFSRNLKTPANLDKAIKESLKTWTRPDGEELVEAKDLDMVQRQLSLGFYYRMIFPHGEPAALVDEWFEIRKNWHKELRNKLKRAGEGMDSPKLLEQAAQRHIDSDDSGPQWKSEFFEAWEAIKDKVLPETETCWLSDFAVQDAATWLKENAGILWVQYSAFALAVAKLSGVKYYAGGERASAAIRDTDGSSPIIASIAAHGTGKNLQHFSTQLITSPPSDGALWEQLLGRTHREGQQADVVSAHIYLHTSEYRNSLKQARKKAFFLQELHKSPQKLVYATYDLTGACDVIY